MLVMSSFIFIVKAKQQFYRFLVFACASSFLLIFTTTLLQILLRRVFHSPLVWAEDLAVFIFIWLTFLGAAILFDKKALISIDAIVDLMPRRIQMVSQIVSNTLVLIFLCYLFNLSWDFMMRQYTLSYNLGGALLVPSWVIMIPVLISFSSMVISSVMSPIQWIINQGDEK